MKYINYIGIFLFVIFVATNCDKDSDSNVLSVSLKNSTQSNLENVKLYTYGGKDYLDSLEIPTIKADTTVYILWEKPYGKGEWEFRLKVKKQIAKFGYNEGRNIYDTKFSFVIEKDTIIQTK